MLFIISSLSYQQTILQWINNHEDLINEIHFLDIKTPLPPSAFYIKIIDNKIIFPIDWYNDMPPLFFPSLSLEEHSLLGILYSKIGDIEKSLIYLKNYPSIAAIAEAMYALQYGLDINKKWIEKSLLSEKENWTYHNTAVAFHYGTHDPNDAQLYYEQAQDISNEFLAFTQKHFALYLIDKNCISQAKKILNNALQNSPSKDAEMEFKTILFSIAIKQYKVDGNLRNQMQEIYHYYEQTGQTIKQALLLIDSSYISDNNPSFSDTLQAVEKAIQIFKNEQQQDLLINALIRKATLLLEWAKSGQPQFYLPATKIFQEVLQLIDREELPHIYAEVHHHLGVIYAEIPDEIKKKSLWAGVSVTSFNEALQFFKKEHYPYEYALICNNFGNAYTKYPMGVLSNNFDKALEWYAEALTIRTQEKFPQERVRTLLNYLEASWYATNHNDEMEKLQKLKHIAQEIYTLTNDEDIVATVGEHLSRLKEAELVFNKK